MAYLASGDSFASFRHSSEKGFVQWRSLAAVEFGQRHFMAILHGGWRPVMVLVCLPDNYEQVVSYVDQKCKRDNGRCIDAAAYQRMLETADLLDMCYYGWSGKRP